MNILKKWWFWIVIVILIILIIFVLSIRSPGLPVKPEIRCSQSNDCNEGEVCKKYITNTGSPEDYSTICSVRCNPETNEPCEGRQMCSPTEIIEKDEVLRDYTCLIGIL